jgi:hypothetical protein
MVAVLITAIANLIFFHMQRSPINETAAIPKMQ